MGMLLNRLVKRDSTLNPASSSDHASFMIFYLSVNYTPPHTSAIQSRASFSSNYADILAKLAQIVISSAK